MKGETMAVYRIRRADGRWFLDPFGFKTPVVWQAYSSTKRGKMMQGSRWAQEHFCPVELQEFIGNDLWISIAKYDPALGKWEHYKN